MSSLSNNSQLDVSLFGKRLTLQRYPYNKNSNLRAWDAADSYLLNTLAERAESFQRICIVHDNFGALALALSEYKPVSYGDSWMSRFAIERNFQNNDVENTFDYEQDLSKLTLRPDAPDCIVGRVPKSKTQLAALLYALNQWAKPKATLFLAGMDKHLSKGQFDLIEKFFGPSTFLPGVKKARIWTAQVDKSLNEKPKSSKVLEMKEFDLKLSSEPNVFSQDGLDIGTRFFLEKLSLLPRKKEVADLACGNGVLGLAYLRLYPDSNMSFRDESFQAISATKLNLAANFPELVANCYADDGLKSVSSQSLQLVMCNPPFHQNNTLSTEIAFSLFKDAKRCLKNDGELWIVANRHLGYHVTLKRLFGNCVTEASNKKFVILKAVK